MYFHKYLSHTILNKYYYRILINISKSERMTTQYIVEKFEIDINDCLHSRNKLI